MSVLATSVEVLEVPLACFAAGGFIYIIVRDLLPNTIAYTKKEKNSTLSHVAVGLLGSLTMAFVSYIVPHEHPEEEHGEQEGEHLVGWDSRVLF